MAAGRHGLLHSQASADFLPSLANELIERRGTADSLRIELDLQSRCQKLNFLIVLFLDHASVCSEDGVAGKQLAFQGFESPQNLAAIQQEFDVSLGNACPDDTKNLFCPLLGHFYILSMFGKW